MATSVKLEDELKRHIFKQEAIVSWTIYQETGLHLTGQEVRTWLSTWGTSKEIEIPSCHK